MNKAKSNTGFFTSNREGGKGDDDIYKFRKIVCEQELSGIITDEATGVVIPGSKVTLFDDKFQLLQQATTDDKAKYVFAVSCGKTYYVRAEKDDYATKEVKITIPKNSGNSELSLTLSKSKCQLVIGGDLAKCFGIKMIYFDLDKSVIRKEAAFELEKILDVMNQNPGMRIDVRSHTDCRQTAKYNEALSDRRAKSTIAWLIKKGIDSHRLTGKGYGESQLVNNCGCEPTNQSSCSEEQHQANRRSEFIIMAIE